MPTITVSELARLNAGAEMVKQHCPTCGLPHPTIEQVLSCRNWTPQAKAKLSQTPYGPPAKNEWAIVLDPLDPADYEL